MPKEKQIVLHSENFEKSSTSVFKALQKESDFYDVSFACTDSNGKSLQAHKIVISAYSSVLKETLRQAASLNANNPLMFFRGISYHDLSSILDFIYQGEACISEERMASFLSVAEDLKIEGLSNVRLSFKEDIINAQTVTLGSTSISCNSNKVETLYTQDSTVKETIDSYYITDQKDLQNRDEFHPKIGASYTKAQESPICNEASDISAEILEIESGLESNDTSMKIKKTQLVKFEPQKMDDEGKLMPQKSGYPRKSIVWNYFSIESNKDPVATCRFCNRKIKRGNVDVKTGTFCSTTGMLRHLKGRHSAEYKIATSMKLNVE